MISSGFDQPAKYCITVASYLDVGWVNYVHGMTIENHRDRERPVATVTGHLPDQAALLGVLNVLYDGHITVLAVERLSQD